MSRDLVIGDDVFILKHVVSLAAKSNFLCLHELRDGLEIDYYKLIQTCEQNGTFH
jgi:hypothetical protein